jgi:cytochrome c peroxidase
LLNVEFTAPYMHDGRFATLEAVIDHYSTGVKRHPNLNGRLRRRLNFTTDQKAALIAFLKTLSDEKFIADPKFSDPFQ